MKTKRMEMHVAAASSRFNPWSTATTSTKWRFDFALTLIVTLFWLWFAWQHGYNNSPDSWYRGVLAKSIADGHPYWINLKQGWLYEFSPWHHDAAHSPLLPVIYALWFLIFGASISVTNVVVSLAAGLSLLPMLRLSRGITGGIVAGLAVYAWVAFNASNDFLFEVFSGLSIPVTVLLLAIALQCFWKLLTRADRRHIVGCAFAMAAYFYVRPGEQLLFFGFLVASVSLGLFMLPRPTLMRIAKMWLLAVILVSPWLARNTVLFGNPFFTHMSPMMWTDRAYDYWSYHESIPLPTPSSYFANHSLSDLALKIVDNAKNAIDILDQTLDGQLLVYIALSMAIVVAMFAVRSRRKRYFLVIISIITFGYVLLHSLVPVIDKRYMIMPIFSGLLAVMLALSISWKRFVIIRWFALLTAVWLFGQSQWHFWSEEFPQKTVSRHFNSDQAMRKSPTIAELRKRFGENDVVLGHIGEVQQLNFATGITFIEAPDNLAKLRNPLAFFHRYQIRYSLVDVTRILPDSQIERIELVGNRQLFTIRLTDAADDPVKSTRAIRANDSHTVFIDVFHGGAITNESVFKAQGLRVVSLAGDLIANRHTLLSSSILVVRYDMGLSEFDERELALIDQFTQAGGRILLLCPAWVAASYENKRLDTFGFNRIAGKFGILISDEYVGPPFTISKGFGEQDQAVSFTGSPAFSRLVTRVAVKTVMADASGQAVIAAAELPNGARIVVAGHNNLFEDFMLADPHGAQLARQIIAWLAANE